jgi:hypothetical protein
MTPKKHKTRDVSRDHYKTYRKKAKEFLNSMEASLRVREWNAAGLNAVHCAISSADALLVYNAGIRSRLLHSSQNLTPSISQKQKIHQHHLLAELIAAGDAEMKPHPTTYHNLSTIFHI